MAEIRNRIKELRMVPARELRANPRNWRQHPKAQREAMAGVLREVGYAGALLARETPDGLELIDGHLRQETTPDAVVPVLVLDVDEREADYIMANRTLSGLPGVRHMQRMETLFPDDLEKIETVFPFIRARLVRQQIRQANEARMREQCVAQAAGEKS